MSLTLILIYFISYLWGWRHWIYLFKHLFSRCLIILRWLILICTNKLIFFFIIILIFMIILLILVLALTFKHSLSWLRCCPFLNTCYYFLLNLLVLILNSRADIFIEKLLLPFLNDAFKILFKQFIRDYWLVLLRKLIFSLGS